MTSKFVELCQKVRLTKTEKKLMDYIIDNFQEACFLTSTELAEAVSVSHSSVIRFAKDLGFRGYPDLQGEIRRQYEDYMSSQQEKEYLIPVEKLGKSVTGLSEADLTPAVLECVRANIQFAAQNNSDARMEAAARSLIDSKLKYIVGLRGSACIASFLQIILRDTLPGVFAAESNSLNVFDFLADIDAQDSLIAISYPRYNKVTELAAELAKEKGANVIVLTDRPTAPLVAYADHVLLSDVKSMSFFNSPVAAMFVSEVLCTTVSKLIGEKNESRLRLVDRFTRETKLF